MIDPKLIVTLKDLNKNLSVVHKALREGEIRIFFHNNQPQAVLMDPAVYQQLTAPHPSKVSLSPTDNESPKKAS